MNELMNYYNNNDIKLSLYIRYIISTMVQEQCIYTTKY